MEKFWENGQEVVELGDVCVRSTYSELSRTDIDLTTSLCGLSLYGGAICAPMSCVTGHLLAEEAWQNKNVGVLHRVASLAVRAEWTQYLTSRSIPALVSFGSREIWANNGALDDIQDAGAYLFCLDASNAGNKWDLGAFKLLLDRYPNARFIIGNFVNWEEIAPYLELLSDPKYRHRQVAFKIGRATGSICSTGVVTAGGSPLFGACLEIIEYVRTAHPWFKGELIADGGIRGGADMAKLYQLGIHLAMFGSLAAGIVNSAAAFWEESSAFKVYYGMASEMARLEAMENGADINDRYKTRIVEGVSTLVPVTGTYADTFHTPFESLAATMIETNCSTLEEFRAYGRWFRVTNAGREKLNTHSIIPIPKKKE